MHRIYYLPHRMIELDRLVLPLMNDAVLHLQEGLSEYELERLDRVGRNHVYASSPLYCFLKDHRNTP